LTDILVVAILLTWLGEGRRNYTLHAIRYTLKKYWWMLAAFLFLLVNSLLATNQGVALYKFVKIIEFSLLGLYVAKTKPNVSRLTFPLSLGVIYSSLIAMAQFINQGTIGGPFWWLGERSFNIITPGIAKSIVNGRLVLRPYATFPHPNVLAGFLLVSLILIMAYKRQDIRQKIIQAVALVLGGIALALSFSRSAWLVGLVVGFWLLVNRFFKRNSYLLSVIRYLLLILFLILVSAPFYFFTSSLSGQEAIDQRLALARVAVEMIKANPLTGIGLNNFIPQLPYYWQQFGMTYWLQPVHNIYLLVAAETGLMGLLIFLWFLILTYKKLLVVGQRLLIILLITILALGLFDHYWLTLQQTQLLFTVVLGLSWRQ